tara:strand:+ start:193 stop:558 length:366 start_codon:yes stop_codon:yes gene_type:complete
MKLRATHIFFVLLAILVLSNFGLGVKEYFENKDESREGIPKSEISNGNEHLYILKSEIVPPVCPKCPDVQACPKKTKCPACPPCGRCPEPAFECKKVPNYNARNDDYLPRPVLNDFSQFGM